MWLLCLFLACAGLSITGSEGKKVSWKQCKNAYPEYPEDNYLDCTNLKFKNVPKDIFETPIQKIKLAENRYKCNCNMEWFIKKLRLKDFTQSITDLRRMVCHRPTALDGRQIYRLKESDVCPQSARAVDECKLQLHKCHNYADCWDRQDGYACFCQTGFTGDGKHCTDIDECELTQRCPADSKCMNSLGTYSCICNQGYRMRDSRCEDINECHDGTAVCHRHAKCENNPGSYRCVCKEGYYGNKGKNCVKKVVKSCSDIPSPCSGLMEECIDGNERGYFKCQCRAGFAKSNDGHCQDIDECKTQTAPCDPIAECQNTEGSYKCVCPKGYSSHGQTCIDIDECANGEDDCHRDADCVNNIGSFLCVCRAGFQQFKDGRLCLKEEEEEEFNLVPIIVGSCILGVLAIALLAFCLYVREIRRRRGAIDKKPLVKGKLKKNWLSNFMFPEASMNRIPTNESVLTIWSDSDDE